MPTATEPRSRRGLLIVSSVLAALYCLFFTLIGWTSPIAVEIQRDFGMSFRWCTPFLSAFNLIWTAPIGVIIAFLLLRKDNHLAHQTCKQLNIVSVIILGGFGLVWLYAVFSHMFPLLEKVH